MSFIAGRYSCTLNALALGQLAEGFRLSHQVFKRLITGDSWGDAPQDAVYRGMELGIVYRLLEFNAAGAQTAFWPYSATIWDMSIIGRCDVASSIAKQIIFTALAGTTAAATPATLTYPTVMLRENYPVELLRASDLCEVPMSQRVYPNSSGVFGTQT